MRAALELAGVTKYFRRGAAAYGSFRDTLMRLARRAPTAGTLVTAIDHLDLRVEPGEIVGVVGDNGAGKSTLLKVIARITPPDEGRIDVRGRLASLIELGAGFHPELTGRENVFLHGSIQGLPRRVLRSHLDAIAEFAGVEDALDTPVKFFSTGMYARLGFAVAVFARPQVLLVDEVLSVGDVRFRRRCYAAIRSLQAEGTAILFVSHDLPAVADLCTRALRIHGGRAIDTGPAAEVVARYRAARAPDPDMD